MPSFLSGCFLFFSCLALCAAQVPGDIVNLSDGQPVSVLLTPEDGATLRLDLTGSGGEVVFFDAAVPDITYRITAGDETEIVSGCLATSGWLAIPVAAAVWREVRIQLKTKSGAEGLPGVRVRVEDFPIPLRSWQAQVRAAQTFNAAQKLHRSTHAEDLRQAIALFDVATQDWKRAGDRYGEALALGGKGESEIELSRYADAKRTLEHALSLAGDNAYLRGWLLHLSARTLFDQWEGKQAQTYAEEEMLLGKKIGDASLIALARTDLAGVAFWLRDSKMGHIVDQAHGEAIEAGVPETLALERRWKGWIEEADERDSRAMSVLNEAESNFRRAGDSRNALVAVFEAAVAVSLNGDLYSALARFSKLEPVTRASGNNMEYGLNVEAIGYEYKELNKPELAEAFFRRAETAYSRDHILFGLMLSHGYLCETELRLNETSNAVSDCKLALTLARQFGDKASIGEALYKLGSAERKAGNLVQAVQDFREAATYSHADKDQRFESKEHIQIGGLREEQGKREEALAEFEQAALLSQSVADPASLLEAQYAVARWHAQERHFEKANAELAPVLEKLEAARQLVSSSTLQASYFAAERKCYELAVELLMGQFEGDHTGGGDAQALEMSERGRARGLLDALSSRSSRRARESSDAEAQLMQAKLVVDHAFDRRLKLLVGGGAQRDLNANSAEMAQGLASLELAQHDVNMDANQTQRPAATMTASEIEQASISSRATFFEYSLGDQHSYLWIISAGRRKSYTLPSRQRLENMVKQWRSLASGKGSAEGDTGAALRHLSAQLSCALLSDHVEAAMDHIVIVPDGGLAMLPFSALPENGCSKTPGMPLLVRHEIVLAPSLSIYLSPKAVNESRTFQGEVAVIADPVFDAADPRAIALKSKPRKAGSAAEPVRDTGTNLPRLINTASEASAINETVLHTAGDGQVFLAQGFDANVETVLGAAIQRYRVWHLATHGVFDESNPEFSGLVFSLLGRDGSPRFGFLKAHDIANLSVPAELVVLSACDSAAGEIVNGEGVMGLSYAFLRAGARQVISALWSVDDASSRDLMVAFYREYIRNGRSAAQALRQSQLAVMRQLHKSSPYYWAGFELTSVGD